MTKLIDTAQSRYRELLESSRSVQLATVGTDGRPDASYAPVLIDASRRLHVYVSELSRHTANLLETGAASAMLIEDEGTAQQLFARRRVTFQCLAREIERGSGAWRQKLDQFESAFGEIMAGLRQLEDFHLIELIPQSGRLVVGFGQAFELSGEKMDELQHLGGGGQGHRRGHRKEKPAPTDS